MIQKTSAPLPSRLHFWIRASSRPFAVKTSIQILQKETKVTKTHFQHTLRASFSWLSSVQISESKQRLVSEAISSVTRNWTRQGRFVAMRHGL